MVETLAKKVAVAEVWWYKPVIPRWLRKNYCAFEASLGYIAKPHHKKRAKERKEDKKGGVGKRRGEGEEEGKE